MFCLHSGKMTNMVAVKNYFTQICQMASSSDESTDKEEVPRKKTSFAELQNTK